MRNSELEQRTKQFALRVIRMFTKLPKTIEAQIMGKQLLRSGTGVAANYREASRGRSNAEMRSKLGIVEGELDESLLWFELLIESGIVPAARLSSLRQETEELLKIIVASIRTLKRRGG
ncbi:MAG TPA: four helix bundle protein [Pirellulales bacterium]|nr:four helix bundle protein [Pirellulales bacterium]